MSQYETRCVIAVCTPVGFVRLFGVVGSFLVKPQFLKNLDEEFFAYRLEEDCIQRRSAIIPIKCYVCYKNISCISHKYRLQHAKATGKSYVSPVPMSIPAYGTVLEEDELLNVNPSLMCLRNGALQRGLSQRLEDIQKRRKILDRSAKANLVGSTYFALPPSHAGVTYSFHCHSSISCSKHDRVTYRNKGTTFKHQGSYIFKTPNVEEKK